MAAVTVVGVFFVFLAGTPLPDGGEPLLFVIPTIVGMAHGAPECLVSKSSRENENTPRYGAMVLPRETLQLICSRCRAYEEDRG
jgi:hypothetical protein